MIKKLSIQNYLFIKNTFLEFSQALNIIIGESGVGKSMLVNILSIPLGYKPGSKVVGKWGKKAVIKMVFDHPEMADLLKTQDLEQKTESNEINLKIEIDKKTQFQINDVLVPIKKVKTIVQAVLDIHSQNNYSIFQEDQLGILTKFMNKSEKTTINDYQSKFEEYERTRDDLNKVKNNIIEEVDLDFYKFQIDEILRVDPRLNEDKELFDELKNIKSKLKVINKVKEIKKNLDSAYSSAEKAMQGLGNLQDIDEAIDQLKSRFNTNITDVEDILWEFTKIEQEYCDIEDQNVDLIEDRINELEDIKRKHRKSIDEINDYRESVQERLSKQDQYKADLDQIQKKLLHQKKELDLIGAVLTDKRKIVADRVIRLMSSKLKDLKLEKTELTASFIKKDDLDISGLDNFCFLVKVNVGSNFYQFDKLSGGETSRVMLALKSALMTAASINVYVFDEIDAGVSGGIAIKMGNVLSSMSQDNQLIVITHLPTIAVKADKLFKIEKKFIKDTTIINVDEVEGDKARLSKLASLLTERPSDDTIAYVKSLK